MDAEKENLLKLLNLHDTFAHEELVTVNRCLSKLGTLNTDELVKEPDKLRDEQAHIEEQLQDLAVSNYRTFLETAQCSRKIFSDLGSLETNLDGLFTNVPAFEETCRTFAVNTSSISNLRRLNSLTLTKSAQLLEILELPQLMDSFIKDGLYEDALELAAYVRKLYAKHPEIPIFKSILEEINQAWLLMLHNLLELLREDLQLARCLQIVSYLRRMEVFQEAELRIKFLQTRDVWLQKSLRSASEGRSGHHQLTKIIEVTRVNLFSIITQYQAIFNDDEHSPLMASKNDNLSCNHMFFSWIRNKISQFLVTLEHELHSNDLPSIDTILGQCMYFGLSLSRVGCDFRGALIPIFNGTIQRRFKDAVHSATKDFERNMERFTLINKNHPNVPWKSRRPDPIQPPESLLEFYPLAEYLNHVLGAFNELRLCPALMIVGEIARSLGESLRRVSDGIVLLYTQEQQAFNSNSKDAFLRMCLCFMDDLVPYVQKCFNVIYPPSLVAAHVGTSVQNLVAQGLTVINKGDIVEPIRHLLPAKVEPVFGDVADTKNVTNEPEMVEEIVEETTKNEET